MRGGSAQRMLRTRRWIRGVIACAALASCGAAMAQTNVAGTIPADTTWSRAGSPYVLVDNVTIAAGARLTIDPGVTRRGKDDWTLAEMTILETDHGSQRRIPASR